MISYKKIFCLIKTLCIPFVNVFYKFKSSKLYDDRNRAMPLLFDRLRVYRMQLQTCSTNNMLTTRHFLSKNNRLVLRKGQTHATLRPTTGPQRLREKQNLTLEVSFTPHQQIRITLCNLLIKS